MNIFKTIGFLLGAETSLISAKFAPLIKALFSQSGIDLGYGCWCHFNSDHFGHGKGEPVDAIDKMCKVLAQGYECVGMDTGGCDPYTVEYARRYTHTLI